MSVITDMVLFTEMHEDEAVARLNAWCVANDYSKQQFTRLDMSGVWGKVFTSQVWALCGNHFRHEQFAEALPSFGWNHPHHVVLVANYEHDECSRVYRAAPEREPSRW